MIQRIQTAYLLAGAILLALMFTFRGIWDGPTAQLFGWFSLAGQILCAATILAAIGAVFLYTNRRRQRSTVVVTQLLDVAFIFVVYFGLSQSGQIADAFDSADPQIMLALVLPVAAYVLFFLARRGIDRDIKLVRSMDRLR